MKTRRHTRVYVLIMVVITVLGLPARMIQDQLPTWYVQYFGDYLWAMLLFFIFALFFRNMSTLKVAAVTLLFTYSIEVSQLFHPQWLEALRSIKVFALILGYGFLWSDIVAYTLGISTGVLIECFLLRNMVCQVNATQYLEKRAERGSREKLLTVLAKAPDTEPEEYDRLYGNPPS
jgi:hypothetical protein